MANNYADRDHVDKRHYSVIIALLMYKIANTA